MARDEVAVEVVEQAALWMARLWADDASDADKAACLRWRAEHPQHELAWSRLQAFEDKLHCVPGEIAHHTLREPIATPDLGRRRAVQLLGLFIAAGGLGYTVRGTQAWQLASAEHGTGTGEIRSIVLADGTHVVLASASAIDVHFTEHERLLILRAGEILLTSGHDPASSPRPLRVQSPHGKVQALGTRFSLRLTDERTRVSVFEGAVQVDPRCTDGAGRRIDAGQGASFSRSRVEAPVAVADSVGAWVKGVLVADNMPLGELVQELARYRRGVLRCAEDVAQLKVSGVFPLRDTDRALHNLALALPVNVQRRTRYWVTVGGVR
ncbi:DUF4880 domain-containing protein [Pseudomonas tructae]|uniref:DUF4880 domain-containing protein n=1 Tax=Pseudomonas tructae TaxID=2518644 RepID=A0A411MJL8_9PSED|nr:FecR domain-containing protein [Pseudomonas tructae]QBF26985.1 DUF4880 domain-containing protein [Pseudomonas tructae]